jgi:hypothetical protein
MTIKKPDRIGQAFLLLCQSELTPSVIARKNDVAISSEPTAISLTAIQRGLLVS